METVIKRFKSSNFLHNASWMVFDRIYQMIVSLVVTMLTARYLGPSNYGIINYIAAFVTFTIPVCNLGLDGIIVKRFVDSPDEEGKTIGTAVFMETMASIVASIVIVCIVFISNAGDQVKITVAILESVQLLFKSAEVIEYWYQAHLKSKYASIVKMIAYTIMSAYRIILLILGKSVEWFAFATSLDFIVIAVLFMLLYVKQNGPKMSIDLKYGVSLLKQSYHFILANLMIVLYSQMDKVMIQEFLGDTEVGLYSASYTICNLWFFVPTAIIASARPIIMKKNKDGDYLNYTKKLEQLYASIFWLGIAVGLLVTVLSKPIILVLYGHAYLGAVGSLVIGIWYGSFAQLGSARSIWILCENMNKYVKYYLLWGILVNFALNYLLIPVWGINGAAFATFMTQFVVCVISPLFYRDTRIHTKLLFDAIFFKWRKTN